MQLKQEPQDLKTLAAWLIVEFVEWPCPQGDKACPEPTLMTRTFISDSHSTIGMLVIVTACVCVCVHRYTYLLYTKYLHINLL